LRCRHLSEAFKPVVRFAGVDLEGSEVLLKEIAKIKGIGKTLAYSILRATGIPETLRVGLLSDAQIEKLERLIRDPREYFPTYLLNRQKDMTSGQDLHLMGSDLTLRISRDIDFEKKIKSWRGIRHSLGLKVRGQRTKSSGRGGVTIGVRKKK
jgi:small subunit ribosomal protein S13